MTDPVDSGRVSSGDEYRFPDGTREVVFETNEGAVLTVREYPSVARFEGAVSEASSRGTHAGVKELPDVEAFEERDESPTK